MGVVTFQITHFLMLNTYVYDISFLDTVFWDQFSSH